MASQTDAEGLLTLTEMSILWGIATFVVTQIANESTKAGVQQFSMSFLLQSLAHLNSDSLTGVGYHAN
jgi:hypothetical protein